MLNYPPNAFPASPARVVTGQFLAKNRLRKRDRAKLPADVIARKVVVVDLTASQLATLCRVWPRLAAARPRCPGCCVTGKPRTTRPAWRSRAQSVRNGSSTSSAK